MITWKLSDIQDIPKQAGIYQIKNVLNGHYYMVVLITFMID